MQRKAIEDLVNKLSRMSESDRAKSFQAIKKAIEAKKAKAKKEWASYTDKVSKSKSKTSKKPKSYIKTKPFIKESSYALAISQVCYGD
jgi:hypothetical protein